LRRPSPAILGSIALHAGVIALAFVTFDHRDALKPLVTSVPVTIVSDMVIAAAAPDNPAETPTEEDASTAPVPEAEPVPVPPEPVPPVPVPPTPTPTPRPAERTPPPPRATPTPPRPTPPRPAPRREEPTLDLDALAGAPRTTPNRGRTPATGQQGSGSASQATGPQSTAFFNQIYPNWILPCDIPGADQLRIQIDVTLSRDGRITAGPTLVSPRSDPVYRAAADGAIRALRQTAPFDVPAGFEGGTFRPAFNTERACRGR
jgi:outer membrane biosynthesis protein TonB